MINHFVAGVMVLLFGSIAGIGLKTLMNACVNLSSARNLCIVSVTLVTGIGSLAVLLNLVLPSEPVTEPAAN